jgi:hypothetical protein
MPRKWMSAKGQKRTCPVALLVIDQFVGALLEVKRNVESERLGGLEVDHQFKLTRFSVYNLVNWRSKSSDCNRAGATPMKTPMAPNNLNL